jgi:glutaredoxin
VIKVYGKSNGCVNCNIAKDTLKKYNIKYKFIDITEDEQALKLIRSLGYRQVPVIENEGDWYTLRTLNDLLFILGY